ncbi:cyanogenic beta-glucosidase-like [Populus alba x Populus x berolinensis]|uniref:Cyanogenic beta-glucosidase-like n=1 Tax=Populus alba x Populus x berolinensis TaxID=444605 RepID=A0AAD6Q4F7_9ROSI|nr:cyanogenic beta-glucosidase-like [Populus alba x Populus x berolinensis]
MATHLGWLFLGMLLRIIFPVASAKLVTPPNMTELDTRFPTDCFNRTSFPPDFIFGVASSAYQYEGHAIVSLRGPSEWDTFAQDFPERIADGSNADTAIDFYNRYQSDLQIVKNLSVDAFRLSIDWSRVIPSGKISRKVSRRGIDFYNKMLSKSRSHLLRLNFTGFEPFITLFHWDIPQGLEDNYGGFLSDQIVNDFRDFAELCFREFGDRVKYWITLNEPQKYSSAGYDSGDFAPGRCSKWVNEKYCMKGNSSTEPYKVAHNLLLSHAAAVKTYKEKYQASQNGKIGITLNTPWFEPYSNSTDDYDAAKRSLDFTLGWFLNPITYGDYPTSMRELVKERLPTFSSPDEVKGTYDFVGLNYYTAYYAANANTSDPDHLRYQTDSNANITGERGRIPIGPKAGASWQYIYPEGIKYLLNYTKDNYQNPIIYITENGYSRLLDANVSDAETLNDRPRIDFIFTIFRIDYEVQVKGYFAWSFTDDFEFTDGYTVGFGLVHINRKSNLTRQMKLSASWFSECLSK